jgi:hypothetical protein
LFIFVNYAIEHEISAFGLKRERELRIDKLGGGFNTKLNRSFSS